MSNSNNTPITWDNEQDNNLLGSLFPGGMTLKTNSEANNKKEDFDTISSKYEEKSQFGKNNLFTLKPEGFFYLANIDRQQLFEDLQKFVENRQLINYKADVYHGEDKESIFRLNEKEIDVTVKINSIAGIINFNNNFLFEFKLALHNQESKFELYIPFKYYKDSKYENKYAIILSFGRGNDLTTILGYLEKKLSDQTKDQITNEYFRAFKLAGSNRSILDYLYETAPDFVLVKRQDSDLLNDLLILSNERIDILGTNENISILNILAGIKDKKKFYDYVNQYPHLARSLFKEFSKRYIEDLIIAFAKIGMEVWEPKDLENAEVYSLKISEFDFDEDNVMDTRIAYWSGYLEKEKKYEIGYTVHQFDNSVSPTSSKAITLKKVLPFAPLKVALKETNVFIPAFVGEYLTSEQLDEDKNIFLNNISAVILPEFTLAKVKPFVGLKIPKIKILKFKSSWMSERIIATKSNETVTLIGNFIKDTKEVVKKLNYPESLNFGSKLGEFNLLNVPTGMATKFNSIIWEKYNGPWLKAATERGDDIIVLSDKFDNSLLIKNIDENSLNELDLIFNTNGNWGRSGNPGVLGKLYYNVGYLNFSNWYEPALLVDKWGYYDTLKDKVDEDFMYTTAHELGHSILSSYRGKYYSWTHDDSSSIFQNPNSNKSYKAEKKEGEINLMHYFKDEPTQSNNTYSLIKASEKDVLGLIWLTKLIIYETN